MTTSARPLSPPATVAATTAGVDVSSLHGAVDWAAVRGAGTEFAYIKATEGTAPKDTRFNGNYVAAYQAGVIRGAYHVGLPDRSDGATQANHLASNGGAWSADGRTLPAALHIEYNPYGPPGYGLSQSAMRGWIADFLATYLSRTGRYAVIQTTANWWSAYTGDWSGPWADHPLWISRWSSGVGALPAGVPFWTFWQHTAVGRVAGVAGDANRDHFNGDRSRLVALANNT